jgi:uncharacterized membrane protein
MQDHQTTVSALARQLLDMDEGDLKPHERAVIERCIRRLAVSRDINIDVESNATFGQHLADQVASVGGSWGFIIAFGTVLFGWMILNTAILMSRAFDPYPYILLNLMLSTLASVQAPIILMSQNRSAARDRIVANHDYEVNLKAEIEIAALHEKLDQIRSQELAMLIKRLEGEIRQVKG